MEIEKSRIKTLILLSAAEAESRVVPGGSAYIAVVSITPRVESRVPRARWTNTSPPPGKGRSPITRGCARAVIDVICGRRAPCSQVPLPTVESATRCCSRGRHEPRRRPLQRRQSGDTLAGARGSAKVVSPRARARRFRRPWRARARPNPIINRRQ